MPVTINPMPMYADYRCYYCFAESFRKLIEKENLPIEQRNAFTREMAALYSSLGDQLSTTDFSRTLHHLLRSYTSNLDPYKEAKKWSNDLVLSMYPSLRERVLLSQNPFNTALRLSIAGNVLDYAIGDTFDLDGNIEKVLSTHFAIDDGQALKLAISKAETVLYLGDNAGEIVFDKLFIETIMHPNLYYAVRGAPVINDVTLDDAQYVGIQEVADVISNGYDAPTTDLNHVSPDFLHMFNKADVIISKGQGNLEGLLGKTDKPVFFLLMVKCDKIAQELGVKRGSFVVKRNR